MYFFLKPATTIVTLLTLSLTVSVANADHRVALLQLQQSVDLLHCSSQDFDEVVETCSVPSYFQRQVCSLADATCQLAESVKCNAPLQKICADYDCVLDGFAQVDRVYCHFHRYHYDQQIAASFRCVQTDFDRVSHAVAHLRRAHRTVDLHEVHHHHHTGNHANFGRTFDSHGQDRQRSQNALMIVLEGLFR